jgi:hypothetical protein
MSSKAKAKKSTPPKKASAKEASKKHAPKKVVAPAATKKASPPLKVKESRTGAESEAAKRKVKAAAAMKAAMADSAGTTGGSSEEEEEFDPAAFFAASGGKGLFKAHVMRKERVDLNIVVRYRFLSGPLVFNAELLNLSKGGLCLKTADVVKQKAVLRIEIPLPHTSELFAVQAECVWSNVIGGAKSKEKTSHTGLKFLPMSLAKQTVINQFIQQRRDEIIMAKIGLDKFTDSVPVAGLD